MSSSTIEIEQGQRGFIAYTYNQYGQRSRVMGHYDTEAKAREWAECSLWIRENPANGAVGAVGIENASRSELHERIRDLESAQESAIRFKREVA